MKRILLAAAAALALASPALAQTQGSIAVKDGTGAAQSLCTISSASGAVQVPCSNDYTGGAPVSPTNPLPVTGAASNAFYNGATGSGSALAAAGVYTGPGRDVGVAAGFTHRLSYFNAFFLADQAGTGYIDCSNDNSTWYVCTPGVTISAGVPATLTEPVMTRYHRARLVNGSTAETYLWVNSSYTGG